MRKRGPSADTAFKRGSLGPFPAKQPASDQKAEEIKKQLERGNYQVEEKLPEAVRKLVQRERLKKTK